MTRISNYVSGFCGGGGFEARMRSWTVGPLLLPLFNDWLRVAFRLFDKFAMGNGAATLRCHVRTGIFGAAFFVVAPLSMGDGRWTIRGWLNTAWGTGGGREPLATLLKPSLDRLGTIFKKKSINNSNFKTWISNFEVGKCKIWFET